MPSLALRTWKGGRNRRLNVLNRLHQEFRGAGSDRRTVAQQCCQAYALLLAAHFQAFCCELHLESVGGLVAGVSDPGLRTLMRTSLLLDRKLDRGNATPGNLGSDFGRLGLPFWADVVAHRPENAARQALLQDLNDWRNAIAHQNFTAAMLQGGRPILTLMLVQGWRQACNGLAESFDEVVRQSLTLRTGVSPW